LSGERMSGYQEIRIYYLTMKKVIEEIREGQGIRISVERGKSVRISVYLDLLFDFCLM